MQAKASAVFVAASLCTAAALADSPRQEPPGKEKTHRQQALEAGAAVLQGNAPPASLTMHLHGAHVAKDDPSHQMEAHHYCRQKNRDFAQCALYDGDTWDANLIGIEYIISASLFESLPAEERKFWHPHNYEILSGELVAPGIPQAAEHALMKEKINSYGKTWHVWNTAPFGMKGDALPTGTPVLEWSFNRDGEAQPGLLEGRDKRLDVDTAEKRKKRADLVPLARPQQGVDAMKGRFPRGTKEMPGVTERPAAQ